MICFKGSMGVISKNGMLSMLLGVLFIFLSDSCFAMATAGSFEIKNVFVWADYSGGAFRVLLKNQDATSETLCPGGYWLDGSNDKNASVLSTALSAYYAHAKVRVYADESDDFSGLTSKECKIKLIVL